MGRPIREHNLGAELAAMRQRLGILERLSRSPAGQMAFNERYTEPGSYFTVPRWTSAGSTTPTSGTLYLTPIALPADLDVTSITFCSVTTGATSPSNWWFGLFDEQRAALALTADQLTAGWAANTAKTLALTAPATTTYEGVHYLGVMVAAATPPTLMTTAGAPAATDIAAVAPKSGASTTGLTVPPSLPFTAAAITAASHRHYAYVT